MADENFNLNPVGSKAHTAVKPTIPEALLVVLSTSLQLQGLVPHGDQELTIFFLKSQIVDILGLCAMWSFWHLFKFTPLLEESSPRQYISDLGVTML